MLRAGLCLVLLPWASQGGAEDWTDSLRFRSEDRAFELRVGGRIHGDAAFFREDVTPLSDHAELRRARANVSGRLFRDIRYRFEYDAAADPDSQIKDAYVEYRGIRRASLRLGHFQEPLSLEELTSSNHITFIERALPNALVSGYKLGGMVSARGDAWSLAGGLFEGDLRGREEDESEGWGVAARGTYAPVAEEARVIHLGASAEYREPPGDRRVSYSARPEAFPTDVRFASTGTLSDVSDTWTLGLEAAAVLGPWSVQAEYLRAAVTREGRPNQVFDGWYVFGSWFLTGESRRYRRSNGTFRSPRVGRGIGAWELAARYSTLDLEDTPITGGDERNLTLGLNWYATRHWRFMLNLIKVWADPSGRGLDEEVDILLGRAQFAF
jgi:phosphate-selective porin OprO/OprP